MERRLLEKPFALLDIGVQGGIQTHWRALQPALEVHGFDALEEEIMALRSLAAPGHWYHAIALGGTDEERDLHIPKVRCSASLYRQGSSAYAVDSGVTKSEEIRRVQVRRLDTLHEQQIIDRADFIKIDCEGAEPEILNGAPEFLARCGILGAEIETSFNASPILPDTHFCAIQRPLLRAGLVMQDLAFDRIPYASFDQRARERGTAADQLKTRARPATFNVLFTRNPADWAPKSADEVIKLAAIFELYGLNDSAYETLSRFRELLPQAIDFREISDLLFLPSPSRGIKSFFRSCLAGIVPYCRMGDRE